MSVRSARRPVGIAVAPHMGHADAAAVVAISAGVVVLLALTDSNGRALLPARLSDLDRRPGIWAFSPGAAVGALCAPVRRRRRSGLGRRVRSTRVPRPRGCLRRGGRGGCPGGAAEERRRRKLSSALLRLLTTRPEIMRRAEALSRRELEVLEMIATGAKNAEIADRFVISQNTVKSHVSQILKKLPASEPHGGRLPLHRAVRGAHPRRAKTRRRHRRRM